jgi:hypothetical protein
MINLPEEYLKALGPELGAIYQTLCDDVSWLHLKWKQYRTLFVESQEHIDLMNRVGGMFFFIIQEVLHDDVLMHIARLVDRKRHKDKENLSLLQLASTVQVKAPNISGEIHILVNQARKKARFVEDWRNRRLAHSSLDVALGRKSKELPEIEVEQIEGFLGALRDVLNKIKDHFWKVADSFIICADRDAEYLMHFLKLAVDQQNKSLPFNS